MKNPDEFELTEGAADAVRRLNDAAFVVVVCTNQRGVALGRMTQDDLDAVHEKMTRELARAGAKLDGIYACMHDKDQNCDCRKPRTGLFEHAAREHKIDVAASFVVGDTHREMEAARTLGCPGILVTTKDVDDVGEWRRVRTLTEAVDVILDRLKENGRQ